MLKLAVIVAFLAQAADAGARNSALSTTGPSSATRIVSASDPCKLATSTTLCQHPFFPQRNPLKLRPKPRKWIRFVKTPESLFALASHMWPGRKYGRGRGAVEVSQKAHEGTMLVAK